MSPITGDREQGLKLRFEHRLLFHGGLQLPDLPAEHFDEGEIALDRHLDIRVGNRIQ